MRLRASLPLLAAAVLAASTASAQTTVVGDLTDDRYMNPNPPVSTSDGTRTLAPIFAFPKDEETTFQFNQHYSMLYMKWDLELPAELEGQELALSSATVTVWQRAGRGEWDPNEYEIKLFAVEFTGESGVTAETWTEATPYFGPTSSSPTPLMDPFFRELGTGLRAEDNLEATPWALGVVDPSFDGSEVPTEAFPITFTLDVSNPEIRDWILDDFDRGFAFWVIASTFPASQPGTGASADYPRLVTKEGVSNPDFGTLQQAPRLEVVVSPAASVGDWMLLD